VSSEWDAAQYHVVSEPQFQWGLAVLARLRLDGRERVIDAGCGSGRLTAELLRRLPSGRVIAVDRSFNMLEKARDHLRAHAGRVRFVQADLADLPLRRAADVVFSTATFHWISDHDRLFRRIFLALLPGGRLHAQCGGGPNLDRILGRTRALMTDPTFAPHFTGWGDPHHFAAPNVTAERLGRAGFVDVETSLEPAPATFASAADFARFISVVVLRSHLDCLPVALREPFVLDITGQAAHDVPPWTLDYWRLNMRGSVPRA
jgi:trans-aconitate 2-methyltransferase